MQYDIHQLVENGTNLSWEFVGIYEKPEILPNGTIADSPSIEGPRLGIFTELSFYLPSPFFYFFRAENKRNKIWGIYGILSIILLNQLNTKSNSVHLRTYRVTPKSFKIKL